jgi:hypothetical protein
MRKPKKLAQGRTGDSVSRNTIADFLEGHGDNCVNFVFQRLEVGRRGLMAEWKVKWNCDGPKAKPVHA